MGGLAKLVTLAAFVALAASALAAPAQAHTTRWYWSEEKAEYRLRQSSLRWTNDLDLPVRDKVLRANCRGFGV
jgi:hypothetical protein